jgi:hypothetical protein
MKTKSEKKKQQRIVWLIGRGGQRVGVVIPTLPLTPV